MPATGHLAALMWIELCIIHILSLYSHRRLRASSLQLILRKFHEHTFKQGIRHLGNLFFLLFFDLILLMCILLGTNAFATAYCKNVDDCASGSFFTSWHSVYHSVSWPITSSLTKPAFLKGKCILSWAEFTKKEFITEIISINYSCWNYILWNVRGVAS